MINDRIPTTGVLSFIHLRKGIEMNYITLYFDSGIAQSYGFNSYISVRDTSHTPTFSMFSGLIRRASGVFKRISTTLHSKENALIEKINKGKFCSISFVKTRIITDFQTIGTNYTTDKIYAADGTDKTGTTVITYKQYLNDVKTACIYYHEDENFLEEIKNCLQHPKHPLCIGRFNCLPTSPIFNGLHNSVKESFDSLIGRVNTGFQRVDDDTLIKIMYPSLKGSSINDVCNTNDSFSSRIVKIEEKTLREWTEQLPIL